MARRPNGHEIPGRSVVSDDIVVALILRQNTVVQIGEHGVGCSRKFIESVADG